jgi:CRP/FNR family cyclic AMP-dependent transcriptional regulator
MPPLKGNTENYQNGETIFEEGEVGAGVFILQEGRVELIKRGINSSVEVTILELGGMFGEIAALDSKPRSITARALGDVTVQVVEQETFLDAMHRDPEFALELMVGLANGMRTLHDMLSGNIEVKTIAAANEETDSETRVRTKNEIFALLKRIFGRGRIDALAGDISNDDRSRAASGEVSAGVDGGSQAAGPVETHEMARVGEYK